MSIRPHRALTHQISSTRNVLKTGAITCYQWLHHLKATRKARRIFKITRISSTQVSSLTWYSCSWPTCSCLWCLARYAWPRTSCSIIRISMTPMISCPQMRQAERSSGSRDRLGSSFRRVYLFTFLTFWSYIWCILHHHSMAKPSLICCRAFTFGLLSSTSSTPRNYSPRTRRFWDRWEHTTA